jgi:hypothetical protein
MRHQPYAATSAANNNISGRIEHAVISRQWQTVIAPHILVAGKTFLPVSYARYLDVESAA